ncbi:hypothetical protein Syun_011581 [Stephania yunnanensis]|uniref:Pentatricopeptide repeat-containing protein n=1 Tax=Stephania yunnanensis TaxID=152371 RepID=A0AAP0PIM4_9MAGN
MASPIALAELLQGRLPTSHLLQIHAQIILTSQSQHNLISTRLIGHYPPQLALLLFSHLRNPNIFPFNALIRVLSEHNLHYQSFSAFKALNSSSLSPNHLTFSFVLKACHASVDARHYATQIHTHVFKSGFGGNSLVSNALLAAYAKGVGDLDSARRVFDEMPERGTGFCWGCLIGGYVKAGRCDEGLNLFLRMVRENVVVEDDTMVSVLSACSVIDGVGEVERWMRLLVEFKELGYGFAGNEERIDTVLVYLYGKLGEIEKSRELFDRIAANGGRGLLHWNSMIGGYLQNGRPIEALNLFHLMMASRASKPNHVTMVSVLSACAQVGNLELGRWVHRYMRSGGRERSLAFNPFLATALIDMYSKCGSPDMAKEVFDQMNFKDVVAFNAMIMGLAVNGEGEQALQVFFKMKEFEVHPNGGTFLAVLAACNHSGLVTEGRKIFLSMQHQCYSIDPELEHYACYIDLLARVGHIEEALEVVNSMPVEPNGRIWGALLGGCVAHRRFDIAQDIARKFVGVDPNNSAGYVMLSNVYATDCRWREILELRELMREKGVRKHPGCSWINVEGVVHEFLVGSSSHPQINEIYSALNGLFKKMKSPDLFAFS